MGGLNKTGSTECPPEIREYLEQYILKQLEEKTDVGKFIDSRNTAVVRVRGLMPAAAVKTTREVVRADLCELVENNRSDDTDDLESG